MLRPTAAALLLGLALPWSAAAAPIVFRPLVADPREDQLRLQFVSFSQDFRYGTDVADSTSVGGIDAGRRGVNFEADVGRTFRSPELERLLAWRGPWERWQLAASGGVFSSFERVQSQLVHVVDYQFGLALDARWLGGDEAGAPRRARVTTRTMLYHRSSHTGDEYVTLSRFGDNQAGLDTSMIFRVPAIRRVEVSYEALRTIGSVEWAPWRESPATVRLYGGGEFKVSISRREPHRLRSPVAQLGVEFQSDGARAERTPPRWLAPLNTWMADAPVTAGWFAAADLKVSRPFDFASCDNPDGSGEVWIPRLWSTCPYGGEGEYRGSWHGMAGLRLARAARDGAPRGGPEVLLSLDWYRGHSPFGPFQDQRLSYHPRWYVLPSVTVQLW